MSRIKPNLILDVFPGWLFDLSLAMALAVLLSTPLALAREDAVPFDGKESVQPTVTPEAAPETEKTSEPASQPASSGNSLDFLMHESPLTLGQTAPQAQADPDSALPARETSGQIPTAAEQPGTPVTERPEEVAMLVSEQCSQSGDTADGSNSCERVYSNGHHATILTQNANEGDELKRQTVIEEFDADKNLLYKKTIRHRVDYNYLRDQKAKEKEFFDIIYQPVGGKTTRELMVYEYFLDTGKPRSLAWTQYRQVGTEPKAELLYHALLQYGQDGSPDQGIAERWSEGEKAETFMDWNRPRGYAALDQEAWRHWESWIRTVSLQAYLN